MLSATELLRAGEISVTMFQCDSQDHQWSIEEPASSFAVVLVRSGVFRRRVDGVELLANPMVGYVECPGSVHQIAHPCGGDRCTVIGLSERVLGSMIDPDRFRSGSFVQVSPANNLAHRLLLKGIRQRADHDELTERAVHFAGQLLESAQDELRTARPNTAAFHRRLTDRVREALSADPHLEVTKLAEMNGVSIYHLSRVFRAVTGMTLSRYRIELRTHLAMDRIGNGDRNLALVAAEVGFADQAHMTRTIRLETAMTPGHLRDVLLN